MERGFYGMKLRGKNTYGGKRRTRKQSGESMR